MRKMIYALFLAAMAFTASSCNNWLDVRPDTEQKEKDQFATYDGFCSAVTGMYMSMADRDAYGERLTMTNIEALANLWKLTNTNAQQEDQYLAKHDYKNVAYSQAAIKAIYAKLFYTIVQANVIIKNVDERGNVILNPAVRNTIQGEAYGIRAYCQLDVLRLFGKVPGSTQDVQLPYSETTNIDEMPAYYSFEDYVKKLEQDMEKALVLLKDNDPVLEHSFQEMNSYPEGIDEFMYYRQSRMNYWAVKALQARMYLYIGQKEKAYTLAKEIIDAQLNGEPVMTMSGTEDFAAGYKLCPSECLFYLSKYDVMDYSQQFLLGGGTQFSNGSHLGITQDMLTELYSGQVTESHNRYNHWWNRNTRDNFGTNENVTITKYYWDSENVTDAMLYYQLIPMLRMSEIYLIAMEGAPTLSEANSLYRTYMLAHDVATVTDFTTEAEKNSFLLNEYRREFFAEGQMFYTYKRLNSPKMLWREASVNESEYVLPLPTTEYNPNK